MSKCLTRWDVALALTDSTQAAYCQAKPNERRLLNQAFFERIEIEGEEVVGYTLAAPFDQLKGLRQPAEAEKAALAARLGAGWNETVTPIESHAVEPFAGSREAKTPGLSLRPRVYTSKVWCG